MSGLNPNIIMNLIPNGWEVIALKYVVDYNKDTLSEDTAPCFEFDYVDIGSVTYGKGIEQFQRMVFREAPSRARRKVKTNDVILSTVRTYLKAVASIPERDVQVVVSTGFLAMSAKKRVVPRFLFYAVQSDYFVDTIEANSYGISYPAINSSTAVSCKILLPPLEEQQAIASYLDDRCSKLDEIIIEAEKSIEEYKELKQAVITEAVTKGLDNNPIVYSGDPNIGDVSEGWGICKTLYGLEMPITDGPHTTPELYDDGVPFISAEAISCGQGSIDFDHMRGYISEEFYQECCKKYIPAIDDIYMIKSGATTGRVSMVDTDRKFTIWSPLAVFRVDRSRLVPRFLFYFLQSKPYQQQVQLGWTFGTQPNIGMRTLEKLKICMPPLEEQSKIVEYLDIRVGDMDALIYEKQSLIEDLKAYKKSLIYEVVTGKRRVV